MPTAALGVLHMMRGIFGSGAQSADDRSAPSAEALLNLLGVVAQAQPGLLSEVLEVLGSALVAMGSRTELVKGHLQLLIQLMLAGGCDG